MRFSSDVLALNPDLACAGHVEYRIKPERLLIAGDGFDSQLERDFDAELSAQGLEVSRTAGRFTCPATSITRRTSSPGVGVWRTVCRSTRSRAISGRKTLVIRGPVSRSPPACIRAFVLSGSRAIGRGRGMRRKRESSMSKKLFCDYTKPAQKNLFNAIVRIVVALPKDAIRFGEASIVCNDGSRIKTKRP